MQDSVKSSPQKARADVQPAFLSPPRKAQSFTLSGDQILQVSPTAAKPHSRHHSEPPRGVPCEADALAPVPRTSTPKSPTSSLLEPYVLPDRIPSEELDRLFETGSRSETSVGSFSISTSSIEFYNVNVDDYQASTGTGFPQDVDPDGDGVQVSVAPSLYSIPNSDPNWFDENTAGRLVYHSTEDSLASETSELQISDQSAYQRSAMVMQSYTNGQTITSPLHLTDDAQGTSLQAVCGSYEDSDVHTAYQDQHMGFSRANDKEHHRLHVSGVRQQHETTQGFRQLADTRSKE